MVLNHRLPQLHDVLKSCTKGTPRQELWISFLDIAIVSASCYPLYVTCYLPPSLELGSGIWCSNNRETCAPTIWYCGCRETNGLNRVVVPLAVSPCKAYATTNLNFRSSNVLDVMCSTLCSGLFGWSSWDSVCHRRTPCIAATRRRKSKKRKGETPKSPAKMHEKWTWKQVEICWVPMISISMKYHFLHIPIHHHPVATRYIAYNRTIQ